MGEASYWVGETKHIQFENFLVISPEMPNLFVDPTGHFRGGSKLLGGGGSPDISNLLSIPLDTSVGEAK